MKTKQAFGHEERLLLLLQTYYEIAEYKNGQKSRTISGTPAIRRSLFWDTGFDTLDWGQYRESVIAHILNEVIMQKKRRLPILQHHTGCLRNRFSEKHIPYKHDIAE